MSSPPRLAAAVLLGLLAAGACGFLLKLMQDMSQSMAAMTRDIASMAADMHRMGGDITVLSEQVAAMRLGVDLMAADVRGMRGGVERMSTVIQSGGKQIEQLNPMGIMQQMAPPGGGR